MILAFLFFFVILSYLFFRHYTWQALPWPKNAVIPPKYQGHRGYWVGGLPENSILSFEAAAQRGFTMVELDVRLSEDNIPVVFHDSSLKRVLNLDKAVNQCSVSELKIYAIPTLEEVLSSSKVPPYLNIELKTPYVFDDTLEKEIAKLIKKYKAENRVLFSSFNPLALKRLSRLLPDTPRALLASKENTPDNKIYLRNLWFAPYVSIHALHLDHKYVSIEDVKKWKKRNVPVALWTINDRRIADAYINAGALSIISDYLN